MKWKIAADALLSHLERNVEVESEGSYLNSDDRRAIHSLMIQIANTYSALSCGQPVVSCSVVREGDQAVVHEKDGPQEQTFLLFYLAHAMKQVFSIDWDLVSRKEHPALDVSEVLAGWKECVMSVEDGEVIHLKPFVSTATIELFSTLTNEQIPFTVAEDVLNGLYRNTMSI